MTVYRTPPEVLEFTHKLMHGLPLGRRTALAKHVGVTKQALISWERCGVPPHRAHVVAEFFGLTAKDIRPDIFL